MIPETALALISCGETLDVEFKGERNRSISDGDVLEAVVCLANRPGSNPGYLFLGVEDDGTITGVRPRSDGTLQDSAGLQALIGNRTRPPLAVRVHALVLHGVRVNVVEVPSSSTPIGTSDTKYLRRAIGGNGKPACLPYSFHEMQSFQADRGLLDYTALSLPNVEWSHLDPLEFERFRRSIRESRGRGDESLLQLSDLELAKVLGAVESGQEHRGVTVLGVLLFGKEDVLRSHLPTHEMAFQVLSGTKVEVNDFLRWPLLRAMEEFETRFRARSTEKEIQFGLLRVAVPDYPARAFREALANACIHREYSRLGTVHVQWHGDRIEISNPGGFPEGVRLDNLLVTPPRPRNPRLADAFKRAGIVERTARGIDTIFEEQLRNGRPAPSYTRSTEANVVLVLPGGDANLQFTRLILEEDRAGHELTLDDLLLLNHLFHDRQTVTAEAARVVQKPESDVRARLQRLVEIGLVESRGERKARAYHLSAATYRRLGAKAAYVRQRGFEVHQHEQMVLDYVRAHGRITRRDAAELCQVDTWHARDLLRKLNTDGRLELHGEKRGSHYVLPTKKYGGTQK